MKCPFCGFEEDKVIESRSAREGGAIRRRRECLRCTRRYTTFEEIVERLPVIVKKDGRREPFSREKILSSMEVACRKRPVPTAILRSAAEDLERRTSDTPESELPSNLIGEMVLDRLYEIDHVAYVRFASVYRDFQDAAEFRDFIASFQKRKRAPVDAR
ncbi:MAG: transcriptional regulator NrdR [Fimbriimonadales bacterium]